MEKPFSRVTTVAVTVILLLLQLVGMSLIGCSSAQPIQLFTPSGYLSYYVLARARAAESVIVVLVYRTHGGPIGALASGGLRTRGRHQLPSRPNDLPE